MSEKNVKKENYKQEIMVALTNCPTNEVSRKAYVWAATNLPDSGGNGVFSKNNTNNGFVFDHTESSLMTASGVDVDEAAIESKKFEKYAKNKDESSNDKLSQLFEKVLNDYPELFKVICLKGFVDFYETMILSKNVESNKKGIDLGLLDGLLDNLKTMAKSINEEDSPQLKSLEERINEYKKKILKTSSGEVSGIRKMSLALDLSEYIDVNDEEKVKEITSYIKTLLKKSGSKFENEDEAQEYVEKELKKKYKK